MAREGLKDRFDKHVKVRGDGCWHWIGQITEYGYPIISDAGRKRRAHRVAYELYVGPIPVSHELHHLCHNRACVNPGHLQPLTHIEHAVVSADERTYARREVKPKPEKTYKKMHETWRRRLSESHRRNRGERSRQRTLAALQECWETEPHRRPRQREVAQKLGISEQAVSKIMLKLLGEGRIDQGYRILDDIRQST